MYDPAQAYAFASSDYRSHVGGLGQRAFHHIQLLEKLDVACYVWQEEDLPLKAPQAQISTYDRWVKNGLNGTQTVESRPKGCRWIGIGSAG